MNLQKNIFEIIIVGGLQKMLELFIGGHDFFQQGVAEGSMRL